MRMDQHIKRMIEKYTIEASRLSGQEALEKYSMAYAQAKELGNDFTLRACAANLGAMYVSRGHADDAEKGIGYLKQAVPPPGTIDCASNGDLYFNMALGYEVLRKFREAGRYYEEALKEYQGERDNLNMEIDTLKRLVQNSFTRSNDEERIIWYKKLEEAYKHANKSTDQLLVMIQRMTHQKQLAGPGNTEIDAELEEEVELCCKMLDTIKEQGKFIVGLLVQVSVLLTQVKKLEKSRELLNHALMLFEAEDSLSVQKAVVLQNLGTVCNYLNDWEGAIPYHKQAAAIYQHYASLPPDPNSQLTSAAAQRCQGHCLAGHAFALVHLDDVDDARVLFDKARDLAVNSGDVDSVWQMDEALGAVHFIIACHDLDLAGPLTSETKVQLPESQLEHLDKSVSWYKKALEDLSSTSRCSQVVLDRVLDKYTQAQVFRKNASKAPPGVFRMVPIPSEAPQGNATESSSEEGDGEEADGEESGENEEGKPTSGSASENEEGKPTSGSASEGGIREKLTKTLKRSPPEQEENNDDDDYDDDSDDGDDEDDDDSDDDSEDPGDDDDDPEEKQLKDMYREQLGNATLPGNGAQRVVKVDVHAQHMERNHSSSAESGTSDDEIYDTSGEESQEEFDEGRQMPPPPSKSPPITPFPSGTYETPQEADINQLYGSDSRSRPRPAVGGSGNYAELTFESKNQRTSGSSQDPDYEPVEIRKDVKSPEPKSKPSSRSGVCSIM